MRGQISNFSEMREILLVAEPKVLFYAEEQNIASYLKDISKYETLKSDEELDLAKKSKTVIKLLWNKKLCVLRQIRKLRNLRE